MLTKLLLCSNMSTKLLLITFVSSSLVAAAPNKLIRPKRLTQEESDMISAATTCQAAILRCCSPDTPTTDATWRCFEKNNCGGLFVVHSNDTRTNIALGACAFLSKVKGLIDEEENTDSGIGLRSGGRPVEHPEEEDVDDVGRNPTVKQNPTNRPAFASNGCHGGSHERCINDVEDGGCAALEQDLESYVKCVHHCVDHCKTPGENFVESTPLQ